MNATEIMAIVLRASCHQFIGRLGADVEVKFFDNGNAVAKGRIAINKPGAKRDDGQAPDWFTVEVWGEDAQKFADQVQKGDRIVVSGRVKTNKWTSKTGEDRTDLIVTAEAWRKMDQTPMASTPTPAANKAAQSLATATDGVVLNIDTAEPLPF
jgi:single stranded DNA-binding protein